MLVVDYNARTNLAAEAGVVLVQPQLPPSSVAEAVDGTAARDVHAQIVTVCVCVHKLLRFVCVQKLTKLLRFVSA